MELEAADVDRDSTVSVEPEASSPTHDLGVDLRPSHGHYLADSKIRVPSDTDSPIRLQRNFHLCRLHAVQSPHVVSDAPSSSPSSAQSFSGLSSSGADLVFIDPRGLLSNSVNFAASV